MEPHAAQHPTSISRRVHQTLVPLLEGAAAVVYSLVGSVFLVAAPGILDRGLPDAPRLRLVITKSS